MKEKLNKAMLFAVACFLVGAVSGTEALAEKGGLWHSRTEKTPPPAVTVHDVSSLIAQSKPAVFRLVVSSERGKDPRTRRWKRRTRRWRKRHRRWRKRHRRWRKRHRRWDRKYRKRFRRYRRYYRRYPFEDEEKKGEGEERRPQEKKGKREQRRPERRLDRRYRKREGERYRRRWSFRRPPLFSRSWRYRSRWSRRLRTQGTGFLINARGYALTSYRAVRRAPKIRAILADGRSLAVKVIGRSPLLDVALIRLQGKKVPFPFVFLGNSQKVRLGEAVISLGNHRRLGLMVALGVVSKKEATRANRYASYLYTDAVIRGNSGGPLFNRQGEVIGISSLKARRVRGFSAATPIDLVKKILGQLKSKGKIARAQLGVVIQPLTPSLARSFGLKREEGVLVARVIAGSAAEKAGLQVGDVILRFNGVNVLDHRHLPRLVTFLPPGSRTSLVIWRKGERKKLTVVLQAWGNKARPTTHPTSKKTAKGPGSLQRIGLGVSTLLPAMRKKLGLTGRYGVRVTRVRSASPAAENNIRAGDIILEVNRTLVESPEHFIKLLQKISPGENILLLIRRKKNNLFFAFPLP